MQISYIAGGRKWRHWLGQECVLYKVCRTNPETLFIGIFQGNKNIMAAKKVVYNVYLSTITRNLWIIPVHSDMNKEIMGSLKADYKE